MNRYYAGYSYIVEITYPNGDKLRREFVSEEEAQDYIDSHNNKLPDNARIKWI